MTDREPLWTKEFCLLAAMTLFLFLATFLLTPTLPLFARSLGAEGPEVGGLTILFYALGCLGPRVLWGALCDRWGRKPVLLVGLAILAATTPWYGLLPWPGTLLLRLIQGVGFSAASTAAAAMAADLIPARRRAEGMGYFSLTNTVGMAIGPALGLFLLPLAGPWGLFGTALAAALVSLLLGSLSLYEKQRPRPPQRVHGGGIVERSVLSTAVALSLMIFPYGGIMGYVATYGADRGVTGIGWYFTVYAGALFLVRAVAGRWADRWGATKVLVPGALVMATGLVLLLWADRLELFLGSAVLFGLGYGILYPVLQAVGYSLCAPERRGAASATILLAMDVAFGLGAMMMAAAIHWWGYGPAFGASAIFVALGLALYWVKIRPRTIRQVQDIRV